MRIGLSVYLQKSFIDITQSNERYFYCNVDFLFAENSKKKIKQYLFFYLSKLFLLTEYNK